MADPDRMVDGERGLSTTSIVPPASLRTQADLLGKVWHGARAARILPFGRWALPGATATTLHPALSIAFRDYLGRRNESLAAWHREYEAAARALLPRVQAMAHATVRDSLARIDVALDGVLAELAADGAAGRLHERSKQVLKDGDWAAFERQVDEMAKAAARYNTGEFDESNVHDELWTALMPRERPRLAPHVAAKNDPLLRLLFMHPRGVELVVEYAASAASGNALAIALVRDAQSASRGALKALVDEPTHVWRYPLLLAHALYVLKLDDVTGIHEYCYAIGRVYSASAIDTAIDFAQATLIGIAILFTGPGGAAVVLGASAGDVVLSGAQTVRTYLRERENDLLARAQALGGDPRGATAFTGEAGGYGGTALSGALALLAGFVLLRQAAALRAAPSPPDPNAGVSPPAPGTQSATAAPRSGATSGSSTAQFQWAPAESTSATKPPVTGGGTSTFDVPAPRGTAAPPSRIEPRGIATDAVAMDARGLPVKATPTSKPAQAAPPPPQAPTSSPSAQVPPSSPPASPSPPPPPPGAPPARPPLEPGPIGYGDRRQPRTPRGRDVKVKPPSEFDFYGNEYAYVREWGHDFGPYVNAMLPPGSVDPAFPSRLVAETNASHVVSVKELFDNPKFRMLPITTQIRIAWHPSNIRALSSTYNMAQQERTFAEVLEHKSLGLPVDPAFRSTMTADYERTKKYIDFLIDTEYRKLGIDEAGARWAAERGVDESRMLPIWETRTPSKKP